jgi:uracil-DNA glycosylase
LLNIFKELKEDIGKSIPLSGNLEEWASQGVLLLNATLTVQAGKAGSHQNKGWEQFTDAVIAKLNETKENLVFLLWGTYAQNKGKFINRDKHFVLKAKHPSPLSANFGGWFGQKHFSQTNNFLQSKNLGKIEW